MGGFAAVLASPNISSNRTVQILDITNRLSILGMWPSVQPSGKSQWRLQASSFTGKQRVFEQKETGRRNRNQRSSSSCSNPSSKIQASNTKTLWAVRNATSDRIANRCGTTYSRGRDLPKRVFERAAEKNDPTPSGETGEPVQPPTFVRKNTSSFASFVYFCLKILRGLLLA
jgi:hypothetical protein